MEGEWERYNTSLYLDIETDLLDALSVGVAVRFENYEDFGSATNGKLSARLRLRAIRSACAARFPPASALRLPDKPT